MLFEDVTAQSGILFIHDSGATGHYFMPEHVGSGAALFDFDNDGRLDLYLVQCGGPGSASRNQLYRQEANNTFRNVSEGSGLDVAGYGMGATAGDINNDGLPDVLVTEYGAARLFLNLGGGKFREITATCGIDNPRWATAASFFDFDRDGWLDLVVANYVDYNPTQKCLDAGGALEYCGPQNFEGTVTRLFHNLGRSTAKV
ncbi:MAG: CRTAC1 family protein, partial [Verrucomicrobia bacterium]